MILEANGQWSERPEIETFRRVGHQSLREENHGGLLVFLTPGLRFIYDENWIFNFGVGFPVIEDLNGIQRKPGPKFILNLTKSF